MEAMLHLFVLSGGTERIMEEFLLNTGSTIDEGRLAKGGSKLTEEYTKDALSAR